MTRRSSAAPRQASDQPDERLADSIDHLTAELRVLREVLDEIREDFSWLTRNGLPIQPIEHVHVKRMALDPCAEDWGEHLEIERSSYAPRSAASPLESDTLDSVVADLKTSFEAAAQGHLEMVLTALDGVRAEILTALRRRRGEASGESVQSPDHPSSPPPASTLSAPLPPPPGRLF